MLFIYIVKILAPVGLYTAVNFKLPYYSPYKKIAVKACEVTTSLVYYPPGSGIKYMTEEFTIFRSISSKYFGNTANSQYPEMNGFETSICRIVKGKLVHVIFKLCNMIMIEMIPFLLLAKPLPRISI